MIVLHNPAPALGQPDQSVVPDSSHTPSSDTAPSVEAPIEGPHSTQPAKPSPPQPASDETLRPQASPSTDHDTENVSPDDNEATPEDQDKSDEDDTLAPIHSSRSSIGAIALPAPSTPSGDMPSNNQDSPGLPDEGASRPENDSDQDDGGGLFSIPLPLPLPVPQPTTLPLPIPLPSPSPNPAPQPALQALPVPPLVAAPIPAYVPQPKPGGLHYVQVHATPHEYSICEIWFSLKEAYPDLFAYAEQSVSRLDREDGSVWFRLRVGAFETSEDAAAFCARLKDQGHECFVVPTADP